MREKKIKRERERKRVRVREKAYKVLIAVYLKYSHFLKNRITWKGMAQFIAQ